MATTYEPIATTTLVSSAASITFSSIAATWTDLRMVVGSITSSGGSPTLKFNGDSTSSYSDTRLVGEGSVAYSSRGISYPYHYVAPLAVQMQAGSPMMATIDVFSYAGSTYKTSLINVSADFNGVGSKALFSGLWRSSSPISSLTLSFDGSGQFDAGAKVTLYGIKAA